MARFEQSEYEKMTYKVHSIPKGEKVVMAFTDMAMFKEIFYAQDLPTEIDPDDLFRYIAYMYDMFSPMQGIQDLKKRKAQAMSLLNIEPPYTATIDAMLRWKLKPVNRRVITFLMVAYGEDYAIWKYNLEKMGQAMEVEINFEGGDEKATQAAISAEKTKTEILVKVRDEASTAKTRFLQGEKSRELEQDLVTFTLQDSLGIRMEEVVMKVEMGEELFPDIKA